MLLFIRKIWLTERIWTLKTDECHSIRSNIKLSITKMHRHETLVKQKNKTKTIDIVEKVKEK